MTSLALVRAEIQMIDVILAPDDTTIHFYDGFIRAPGQIDVGSISFVVAANNFGSNLAWADDNPSDDEYKDDIDDGGNGGGRSLSQRSLDGGIETDGTALDIVVFPLPDSCSSSRKGCDYTDFGVGARTADGTLRWCCTNDAIEMGMCSRDAESAGRLIIDKSKFSGESRFVNFPPTGDVTKKIKHGLISLQDSGHYVVVMANCNRLGRPVQVKGNMVWKSVHGYLPGQLLGIMRFFIFLTLVYLTLTLWYGISMVVNRESRIPIEKWVFFTILLGLIEMSFQSLDFMVWNATGFHHNWLAYMYIITGSLKQGISRCLAVMIGLGWGVIRDSLGSTMQTIVILGTVYTALSVLVDLLVVFAIQDLQTLSESQEDSLFNVASVLTFVLAILDVVFFMWMLDALNSTMEYLENMNQTRKLKRYLQLRMLFLFTMLAAVFWAVFSIVDTYDAKGILLEENEWVIEAFKATIYVGALTGVAWLWRPHPNAKEYAYVMELPAMGADGDNDLELSGSVPSALDDDEEDEYNSSKGKTTLELS